VSVAYIPPTPAELAHADAEARAASLMGALNATAAALVDLLAEVLAGGVWRVAGIRSPQHWATWRLGVADGRARKLVRIAARAAELPGCMGLFRDGALTEDQMFEVAERVPGDLDKHFAVLAPQLLVSQLRRALAHLPVIDADSGEPQHQPRRHVSFGTDDNGWGRGRWCLPPDEAALLAKAVTEARQEVFDERAATGEEVTWADGLLRLAEAGLDNIGPEHDGRRGPRHQVMVHVETNGSTRCHLGGVLPDALARYLTCDATVRAMTEDAGRLLGISPAQPTVDWRLRAYVEQRDGGCAFPGCGAKRWLHIHHLIHREHRGPTVPCNLLALCPHHHRLYHAGAFRIEGDPELRAPMRFINQHGVVIGAPNPRRRAPLPPGAATATYRPPSGERLDTRWITWN
jgi:hypothetical protein